MVWNELIARLPGAHLLQTEQWAQVKQKYGWQPHYLTWDEDHFSINQQLSDRARLSAACLVLQRAIPMRGFGARLSVMYCPKGPLLDWGNTRLGQRTLTDLRNFARQHGAIFIKIDPDVLLGTGIPGEVDEVTDPIGKQVVASLGVKGWHFSGEQIQFRNTALLDLAASEDQLLANMKQKTRYNIRLADRKGVSVRVGTPDDYGLLYRMYAETSVRDGFAIRDEDYYQTVFTTFPHPTLDENTPCVEPLIAEVEGETVAAVVIFRFAKRAWYLYGMSRDAHREKMPNHLLQWEAMRRAKEAGCTTYDLWGAPDVFNSSDTLWGVLRFKQGLGAQVARFIGAWDLPVRPIYYQVYTQILPQILNVMRNRGKKQTQQSIAG